MCRDGRGTTKKMAEAVNWFLRAAEQGDKFAQHELALAYKNGAGVAKDMEEYASWLHMSAKQGWVEAEYELAVHYEDDCKDLQQARRWYQKAANQGHKLSKTRLLQLGFSNERES
jgi:TPR repeat protein